jgi:hypothetical protein
MDRTVCENLDVGLKSGAENGLGLKWQLEKFVF